MADWFYVAAGEATEATGPIDEVALQELFNNGSLPREETQVWHAGLADWLLASEVAAFSPAIFSPAMPEPSDEPVTEPVFQSASGPAEPAPTNVSAGGVDYVIAPVVPRGRNPAAATPPPAHVAPSKPPAAPAGIQIVRPNTIASVGPKLPGAPPAVPPTSPPPVPITNAGVLPPLPHLASAPATATPPAGAPSDNLKLAVPLWVKGAGLAVLLIVLYSWHTLPWSFLAAYDFESGKKAEARKDYAAAQRDYQGAVNNAPTSRVALTRLGVLSIYVGDAKTSDWVLKRLQDLDGVDGSAPERLEVLNAQKGGP